MLGKVVRHSRLLISRDGIDVRKAAAGSEPGDGDLRVGVDVGAGRQVGRADGGDVGARRWEVGAEDATVAEAAVGVVVAAGAGDARVARGEHDGDALEAEFHEFVALPLLVGGGEVGFLASVGDGNYVCLFCISWDGANWDVAYRLVDTALQSSFVSTWCWVGVWWVERRYGAAV